ncbi:MAG: hypothetical protein JOZ18_17410 [Chloroflexi bacterium]|nr:hypothetical protein [Chloroflexota bacterium]
MDQQIKERLRVYEQEDLASPAIVTFVRTILLWLEQTSHYDCTEEAAGPLASHLMLALARVSRGEELGSVWDSGVHEEAMGLASLISWAEHIHDQAKQSLGLTLPPEEIDFLLLHLGAFLLHYNDPQVL